MKINKMDIMAVSIVTLFIVVIGATVLTVKAFNKATQQRQEQSYNELCLEVEKWEK